MTDFALVGLAFGIAYALANVTRRTPPMSGLELLFGGREYERFERIAEGMKP